MLGVLEVEVLALRVREHAEPARLVDAAHRDALRAERRRLEERVHEARLLHRLDEPRRAVELLLAPQRRHGARCMVAAVERAQDEVDVAWRVRGDEHGVHVLPLLVDHRLGGCVGALRAHDLGELRAAALVEVGGGHHLHVGVVLEEELRAELAHAVSGDAHAHLLVAERLPGAAHLLVGEGLVEALDVRQRLLLGRLQPDRRRRRERSDEEVLACDLHVIILSLF